MMNNDEHTQNILHQTLLVLINKNKRGKMHIHTQQVTKKQRTVGTITKTATIYFYIIIKAK